ncbi:hypothetical protein ACFL3A_12965 [Pseudomonadota bacterium]
MSREVVYDKFIDLFLDSADDYEPYGLLSPESLTPVDVQTAWSSSPPPFGQLPEDWQ